MLPALSCIAAFALAGGHVHAASLGAVLLGHALYAGVVVGVGVVAVAITDATRRNSHLAADAFALRYPPRLRRLLMRIASVVVLAPWALFIVYASWPMVVQSVRQLESFPETYDPGYFIVKIALLLLALLILLQVILDAIRDGQATTQ